MARYLTRFVRSPQLLVLLGIVAAAVVVFGSLVAARQAPTAADRADQQAIQKVVLAALTFEQNAEVPPGAYHPGKLSDSVSQTMLDRAPSEFGKYYIGEPLGKHISTFRNHIQGDKTGNVRYLAGGVDSISYSDLSVTGNSALVVAQAVVWNRVAQDNAGKLSVATPKGPVDFTLTLVKVNGVWVIDSENWHFVPGYGP